MKKRLLRLLAVLLIAGALWCAWALWRSCHDPQVNAWTISAGLARPVRLAVLSDLHGWSYGENNRQLAELVAGQEPDLILLDGDMLNAGDPGPESLLELVRQLTEIAPVYYAWGNHELEYLAAGTSELEAELAALGVPVLELTWTDLEVDGVPLRLGGLYDYAFALDDTNSCNPDHMDPEIYQFLTEFQDTQRYKILLCHRPDSFVFGAASVTWDVDLVISGHNHGGQVVLPLLGGVFGGDQGYFPEYVHGVYEKDNITLAVTSGLGSSPEKLPRFNNPPEIMILDLTA